MFTTSALGTTALSLLALTTAAPTGSSTSYSSPSRSSPQATPGVSELATFDDLTQTIPAVALQDVGPYDGLDYEGLDLITLGIDGAIVAGLIPFSAPRVAAYSIVSGLTSGTPTITADYDGSAFKTFDFEQFYFGCVLASQETLASTPMACTVQVTGYDADGLQIAGQTFDFEPTGVLTSEMQKAVLSEEFKGLTTVEYATTTELAATLIDSLSYVLHQ